MLYPLRRKAAPFYPAVRGRTESLRFTALNTLCTAALSGSSFKNALPSRRWPSRRLYTCATTIPCPASVTASTLANSKQVSPAARFTAASAASETHRRRAKGVFALSPWPVYVSQPRASVTEADTRPPALLISSPVWARRKSPRGASPSESCATLMVHLYAELRRQSRLDIAYQRFRTFFGPGEHVDLARHAVFGKYHLGRLHAFQAADQLLPERFSTGHP